MNTERDLITVLAQLEQVLVETLLPQTAQDQFSKGAISHNELTPYVTSLKRTSNHYINRAPPLLKDELDVVAYALYYVPINFVKVRFLIEKISSLIPRDKILRVLDFGCGPGTASLAVQSFLRNPLEIQLVDHSQGMTNLATRLIQNFAIKENSSIKVINSASSLSSSEGKFDLAIAANSLNELSREKRMHYVEQLVSHLSEEGILLLLEPALKETTRDLMEVRDLLRTSHPELTLLFPCTTEALCPMRRLEPANWCHGTLPSSHSLLDKSRLIPLLDEQIGFNKHRLKYSSLILKNKAVLRRGYRVIIPPEKTRGGTTALLCGNDYYGSVYLPKREESESNRAFKKLRSYELTEIDTGSQLTRTSVVRVVDPET